MIFSHHLVPQIHVVECSCNNNIQIKLALLYQSHASIMHILGQKIDVFRDHYYHHKRNNVFFLHNIHYAFLTIILLFRTLSEYLLWTHRLEYDSEMVDGGCGAAIVAVK